MEIRVIILMSTDIDVLTKTLSPNMRNLLLNFCPEKYIINLKQDRLLLLPFLGNKNLNLCPIPFDTRYLNTVVKQSSLIFLKD